MKIKYLVAYGLPGAYAMFNAWLYLVGANTFLHSSLMLIVSIPVIFLALKQSRINKFTNWAVGLLCFIFLLMPIGALTFFEALRRVDLMFIFTGFVLPALQITVLLFLIIGLLKKPENIVS